MSERDFHGGKPLDRRYELHTILGTGATATVYKARDNKADKLVAVKVFNPSVDAADIEDEARTQARLHHPNILPFYWYGEHGEYPYIAMMLAKQGSLDDRLAAQGKLPLEEALQVIDEAAEGVQYAHEEGVVHRDLKPRNILLDEDAGKLVRVSDWGIAVKAHSVHSEFTRQEARGTVAYIAPEQLAGKSTKVTDLYSLGGLVAFELVAGERPFKSTDDESYIEARLTQTPATFESVLGDEMTAVHAAIEPVIQQALSRRPTERQGSVGDYAEQLRTEYEKGKAAERKERTHITMPTEPLGKNTSGSTHAEDPADTKTTGATQDERLHSDAGPSHEKPDQQTPQSETLGNLDAEIQERLGRIADLDEKERVAEARIGELYLEIAEETRNGSAAVEKISTRIAALEEQERAAKARLSKLDQDIAKKTKKGNADIDAVAKRLAALEEQESTARATISELNQEIETKSEQSRSMDEAAKDDQSSGDETAAEIYTSTGDALLDAERSNPLIERAKEILGKDFFGVEAIRKFENVLKEDGVNIEFNFDSLPEFPYTEKDLLLAKELGERLILRTDTFSIDALDTPLNIYNLAMLVDEHSLLPEISLLRRAADSHYYTVKQKKEYAKYFDDKPNISQKWSLVKKVPFKAETYTGTTSSKSITARYAASIARKGADNTDVQRIKTLEAVWDFIICSLSDGYLNDMESVSIGKKFDKHVTIGYSEYTHGGRDKHIDCSTYDAEDGGDEYIVTTR